MAIESADLVLIEDDPLDVVAALKLSKATYRQDDSEPLLGDGVQRRSRCRWQQGCSRFGACSSRPPSARC